MNKDRHPDKTGRKTGADDRAARQALALRENLARRKAQARSRAEGAGGNGGGGVTAGSNITIPGDEPRGDSED
ncbi:hypothetical protein [Paracoccus alkenifer]|uniref:Uncharacterized protein n=1 Tax=Paracoccus alkenifer TaxID=65735 RepID=A0A1H6L2T8_9RHOB|nr:hypothetical protein [Paracoccus alkenifer]SEH78649.1 hypothetical protein SAMN04488075_1047 [Paracoccus alkenifer]